MNLKILRSYIYTIILGLLCAVNSINCSNKADVRSEKNESIPADTVAVKAIRISPGDIILIKTFTGTLEGENQANIVSKISERITEIKVRVGDAVTAGEVILTLDKSGVTSQYYQARAGFLNAEKDFNRMSELYKAGAVSQQMLDGTRTAFEIAKANFDAAKASVELIAPISGIVTAVNSNIGDLSVPGVPLISIASIKRMKVIFSAGEEDIPNFAVGQRVEVYSEVKPREIQKGTVVQISKSADIQSRSFDLKAIFPNTGDMWFKPGMFCRVKVELQKHRKVLIVPNMALINSQNSSALYVVNNGIASLRSVKAGITDGNFTEIIEGVNEGETVVTLGINNLKNGSAVHISE